MGKFSFVCFVVLVGIILGQVHLGWNWFGLPLLVLFVAMGWFLPVIAAIGGSGRSKTCNCCGR